MSSMDKRILMLVSRISKRIQVSLTIGYVLVLGSLSFAACILMFIVSLFIPVYDVYTKIIIISAVSIAVGIIIGFIKKPDLKVAARRLDSFGLQERAVTAVELIGKDSEIALLQKEDAISYIKNTNYRKHIPLVAHEKILLLFMVLAVGLMTTGFIPNPMNEIAEQLHQLDEAKVDTSNKLDNLINEAEKDPGLTEEQKSEIKNRLTEVKETVDSSKDREELDEALKKSAEKMDLLKQKLEQGKKDAADTLSKADSTKDLADAIKRNDKSGLKDAVNKLNEKLKGMDDKEKNEVSDVLSKLANGNNADMVFKRVMQLAADEISKGSALSEGTLQAVEETLSSLMDENDYMNKVNELSEELNSMTSSKGDTSDTGIKSSSGEGRQQNNNGSANNGQPTNAPAKEGAGSEGSGQGSDSTGTPGAGITKKDSSIKKTGEYEKVFTPSLAGGTGESSQLKGKLNKTGSTEISKGDMSVDRGESVSYDKVYGQYMAQAMENINTSTIPEGMKEIVRNYFSSLDE